MCGTTTKTETDLERLERQAAFEEAKECSICTKKCPFKVNIASLLLNASIKARNITLVAENQVIN